MPLQEAMLIYLDIDIALSVYPRVEHEFKKEARREERGALRLALFFGAIPAPSGP